MYISLAGPADLVRLLIAYPLRWLVPAVMVVLAAGGYATSAARYLGSHPGPDHPQ